MKIKKTGERASTALWAAVFTLFMLLSGCGGGSGAGSSQSPTPEPAPEPEPVEPVVLSAGGVKGPLLNAQVKAYSFDGTRVDMRSLEPVAEGLSSEEVTTVTLEIANDPEILIAPLIVEVTADELTQDLTSGAKPVITSLRTAITEESLSNLDGGRSIYATPLSTVAVDLAIALSGENPSAEVFTENLELAAQMVHSTLGVGISDRVDLYLSPPVLTADTVSLEEQYQVAEMRSASEAVAALVLEVQKNIRSSKPESTVSTDQILKALAEDLTDGTFDGKGPGGPVPALTSANDFAAIMALDPSSLMVPGTEMSVDEVESVLVDEAGITCDCDDTSVTSYISDGSVDFTPTPAATAVAPGLIEDAFPRVVSAISTGNDSILLTFNRAMDPETVETASHYSIVQTNINPEVGTVRVTTASMLDEFSVALTTSPQSEVTYSLTVTNARDTYGRQIEIVNSTGGETVVFNETEFAGTPPTVYYTCNSDSYGDLVGIACSVDSDCWDPAYDSETESTPDGQCVVSRSDFVDSDGDGITDDKELRGYSVTITYANGTTETREVTSDPNSADTDGDGIDDRDELRYGGNPRDADTDSDGLDDKLELNTLFSSPYAADTDGDGLEDGLEFDSLQTSPIHADTDGDQLTDYVEVIERYRNPRIADLPRLKIVPSTHTIILNEVFTYTDTTGNEVSVESSSSSQFGTGTNREVLTIDETVDETIRSVTGNFTIRGGLSENDNADWLNGGFVWGQAEVGFDRQDNEITTTGTNVTEVLESQRVLENSYSKGSSLSTSSEVTREVQSAALNVAVTLQNTGDVAFSVSDIEISVLRARPGSSALEPLATLAPNAGNSATYYLGPFGGDIGPLIFNQDNLPVGLAEELMLNPAGIVFRLANYELTDEFGRQFSYINQDVKDRTAGLVIDYGFEGVERYQMAVSTMQDLETGEPLGEFDGKGMPTGLPLTFLLENQLGWQRNPTTPDAIIAGVEGIAQTVALGDDVQRIAVGTRGLGIGEVIVQAGPNGHLDSVSDPDSANRPAVTQGFDTSSTCGTSSPVIFQGSKSCSVDSQCVCTEENGCPTEVLADAEPDNQGFANAQCDGPQIITRVGGYKNQPGSYRWIALTDSDSTTSSDIDSIVMKPGESFKLAFVQDLDKDGLFARQEFMAGTTDSPVNREDNVAFGDTYRQPLAGEPSACAFQTLPYFCGAEAEQSVRIPLADSRDTDRDGMEDGYELKMGWEVSANGQPRRQVYSSAVLRDSDGDGLTDWQERDIRFSCAQQFYTAGENRQVEGDYFGPLRQDEFAFSEYTIASYPQGYENQRLIYADTFTGSVLPSESLLGDDLLSQVLDYSDNTAMLYIDKVAPYCQPDVADPSTSDPDDYISRAASLDPQNADTDGDGVDDGKELMGYEVGLAYIASEDFSGIVDGQDPVHFAARGDDILVREFSATTERGDVIYLPGPNGTFDASYESLYRRDINVDQTLRVNASLLDTRQPERIRSNPLSADSDGDLLFDGAELSLGTNPVLPGDVGELKDSDGDGVFDIDESRGLNILVNGASFVVRSNPARADTDGDGLPDFVEYQVGSNPESGDTDGDGLSDYDEFSSGQFSQYAAYAERFSSFELDGSGSKQLGTLLNQRDSDSDGLTDGEEIAGFNLVTREGGLAVALLVKTNPLSADTDADGLSDQEELTTVIYGGNPPLMTNPLKADSDDDGVGDAREIASGTDPLERDRMVTVRFYEMSLFDSSEAEGDWDWLLRIQDPGALAPGEVVNTDEEYIQSPLACTNCRYIGYPQAYDPPVVSPLSGDYRDYGWIEDPNGGTDDDGSPRYITGYIEANQVGYMLPRLGDTASKSFILREGQSFSLSGVLMQANLPNGHGATPVNYSCVSEFAETYNYMDIAAQPSIQQEVDLSEGSCVTSVRYEITTGL